VTATYIAVPLLALIAAAVALTGAVTITISAHNTFILLDGAWRVLNGQRPHVDFYSALGPVWYLTAAAGLRLAHNAVNGLAYGTALTGFAVGLWAHLLVRRSMIWFMAVLTPVVVALTAVGPFPLGEPFYYTSYAMQYNRYGYALLALVLIECFQGVGAWGISSGVASGLLLFLKANFFVAAVLVLVTATVLSPRGRRLWIGAGTGFAVTVLCMLGYLHFSVASLIADWRLAGAARTSIAGLGSAGPILIKAFPEWLLIGAFATLSCFIPARPGALRYYYVAVGAALIAVNTLLAMSNTQRSGSPLNLIFIALVINQCARGYLAVEPAARERFFPFTLSLVLLGVVMMVTASANDVNGMMVAWKQKRQQLPFPAVTGRIDASPLSGLAFTDYAAEGYGSRMGENGRAYAAYVNDGLDLLRRDSNAGDKVLCLCFSNPFSYSLLRAPAAGGSTLFAPGFTYTARHLPSPERVIGNADVVMIPKQPTEDASVLAGHCGAELSSRFRKAAESSSWTLYRRL
jgi:hypothetical protein